MRRGVIARAWTTTGKKNEQGLPKDKKNDQIPKWIFEQTGSLQKMYHPGAVKSFFLQD
jgi:hypothetical protein